eukprot:scpid42644/ scgid31724/ 
MSLSVISVNEIAGPEHLWLANAEDAADHELELIKNLPPEVLQLNSVTYLTPSAKDATQMISTEDNFSMRSKLAISHSDASARSPWFPTLHRHRSARACHQFEHNTWAEYSFLLAGTGTTTVLLRSFTVLLVWKH